LCGRTQNFGIAFGEHVTFGHRIGRNHEFGEKRLVMTANSRSAFSEL